MELHKGSSDTTNAVVSVTANNIDDKCNGGSYSTFQSKDPIIEIPMESNKTAQDLESSDPQYLVTHPTTYIETLVHIFKGNIGAGMFAMGDAFKNAGLIFAPIMTIFLGVISVHSQHLLLDCSDEMYRRTKAERPPDFANTVHLCFATGPQRTRKLAIIMKSLVNIFLCVTQLGFCCVYFVFISNNVKKICDHYFQEIDLYIHMIIVLVPILLACLVRNLKYLTPFSTVANLLMAVGISVVVYYAVQDLPPISDRVYIAKLEQLPLFFGTAIYAFEGIGLVLPLKNEMRKPEQFQRACGVLNFGMVVVAIMFVTVGFLGYLKWGDEVEGSLTLNLPAGQVLSSVVQGLIAVAILFTFPLQFYVPVDIMWPSVQESLGPFRFPVVAELAFRAALVFLTFILAESIPKLGLFISLVGAISSTALALIFPPIIDMVARSQDATGLSWMTLIKNSLIIIIGFLGFLTGTYESVSAIIKAFHMS